MKEVLPTGHVTEMDEKKMYAEIEKSCEISQ